MYATLLDDSVFRSFVNDKRERKERWSRRWEATQGHSGLGDHDQVFEFYSKNKKKLGGIFTEGYSQDLIVFLEAHAGYLGVQPHWI